MISYTGLSLSAVEQDYIYDKVYRIFFSLKKKGTLRSAFSPSPNVASAIKFFFTGDLSQVFSDKVSTRVDNIVLPFTKANYRTVLSIHNIKVARDLGIDFFFDKIIDLNFDLIAAELMERKTFVWVIIPSPDYPLWRVDTKKIAGVDHDLFEGLPKKITVDFMKKGFLPVDRVKEIYLTNVATLEFFLGKLLSTIDLSTTTVVVTSVTGFSVDGEENLSYERLFVPFFVVDNPRFLDVDFIDIPFPLHLFIDLIYNSFNLEKTSINDIEFPIAISKKGNGYKVAIFRNKNLGIYLFDNYPFKGNGYLDKRLWKMLFKLVPPCFFFDKNCS